MGSLGTGDGPAAQSTPHHHVCPSYARVTWAQRARFVRASIIFSGRRSSSHSSRPFGYRPKRYQIENTPAADSPYFSFEILFVNTIGFLIEI